MSKGPSPTARRLARAAPEEPGPLRLLSTSDLIAELNRRLSGPHAAVPGTNRVTFVVDGNPVPTARPRVVRLPNGALRAFTPTTSRRYQILVAANARQAMAHRRPMDGPVRLAVALYRANALRCDLDNLVKSILDGLTLGRDVWVDDSQVVELHATLALSRTNPRAEVSVEALQVQLEIV